jgi:hypothetical protein
VTPDEVEVIPVAQLLCAWWFVTNQAQPRDASAFLVDRNDRFDLTKVAQIVDELSELGSALDVASEKNERARLHTPKQAGGLRIKFLAGHTGHNELTKPVSIHWRQASTFIGKRSMMNSQSALNVKPQSCRFERNETSQIKGFFASLRMTA